MAETTTQTQNNVKPSDSPIVTRAEIQLMLWDNCKYLNVIINDFKDGKKAPSKKWNSIVYLMQGQNTLLKTLLDSIKDSEIDDLTKQIAEIKTALEKKGVNQ